MGFAMTTINQMSEMTARGPDETLTNDWHAVAFSRDIVEDKAVSTRLLGEDIVIWRSQSVHVWKDRCIHRGAPLSRGVVKGCRIACPYHGWEYDPQGNCTLIPAAPDRPPPARARATILQAKECNGIVWASLGTPAHDVPQFPEWADSAFMTFEARPYQYGGNAFRTVENFFDTSHLPFVHPNLNGVPAKPDKLDELEVFEEDGGLRTSGITVFQPYGDPRGIPVYATYRYRVLRPTTAAFSKSLRIANPDDAHRGRNGDTFCTYMTAQPLDEENCIVRVSLAVNFSESISADDVRRRTDIVFDQDREIVELQRPKKLPLELNAEMHVRSDRLAVAYRRWLKKLNVKYGTLPSSGASG
jgi:phenylpropionate dioxygenase-like ring-hydroxylating dioxygenase large terminal subunit